MVEQLQSTSRDLQWRRVFPLGSPPQQQDETKEISCVLPICRL